MKKIIPMFPLSILPLPGELVPLYIFEPRYRELLQDTETNNISFGIFFNNVVNTEKIGSMMKLESVIKRYPTGESDVVVKCYDTFKMDKLYRTYKTKMYPSGEVEMCNINLSEMCGLRTIELYQELLERKNSKRNPNVSDIYSMAQELNFDLQDRYQFLTRDSLHREKFLICKIKYVLELLKKEEKSRDVYHLN